jgi:hypothetical protein
LAWDLEGLQQKTASSSKPQPLPDEEPALHTARMWEWLESTGFYKTLPPQGLNMKSPEIHPRGVFLPTATSIRGRKQDAEDDGEKSEIQVSTNSLFDRLQSLLVEEDSSDETTIQSYGDEEEEDEDDSLGFLDEEDDDTEEDISGVADLSQLTLEERTFIQLCSAGLIRQSLFPKVELALSADDENAEDDLVNAIGEMSADLSQLTTRNNSRICFLESAVTNMDSQCSKQVEEEQVSLIAKCQSLLKRNKEKAKKQVKQKKDDNLNLPW